MGSPMLHSEALSSTHSHHRQATVLRRPAHDVVVWYGFINSTEH